ncbi:MAG: DoxX family protein [Beijerinckiaceae bacterium]
MFYEGRPPVEIVAQIMIAILYIGTGIINAGWRQANIIPRMGQLGTPMPRLSLYIGFAMQFVGGFMILFDWHARIGAALLIVFTLLAAAIFHRFWEMNDPYRYDTHRQFLFNNTAVIGGLLFIISRSGA